MSDPRKVHADTASKFKKVEAQLRLMTKVFMDSADPIVIRDLEGCVLDVNHETERVFGWSRAELIGKRTEHLHPAELRELLEEAHERLVRGEIIRSSEITVRAKSGRWVPALITAFLLTNENDEVHTVGPAGTDKGKGGRYLFLPPGYKGETPDGFFPVPMDRGRAFAGARQGHGGHAGFNRPREGMDEKLALYNRLQTEDPAKAHAMLKEFMSDEAVVAALGKPVEFGEEQTAWLTKTLAAHPEVRWTFFFMHEPCWENPSESFKAIQKLLKGRKHTFFAGHLHYYDYDNIDGVEYITMGPAGASFHQEGPGNVDHLTRVTMTERGPQIGNIALKGVFDRKGLDPELFGAYDRKGQDKAEPKDDKKE
jgi:PAS domain S-box-containing protein